MMKNWPNRVSEKREDSRGIKAIEAAGTVDRLKVEEGGVKVNSGFLS